MCWRTGTVGFHPEPHHYSSVTGEGVYVCYSRKACRSRFFRALRRGRWAQ